MKNIIFKQNKIYRIILISISLVISALVYNLFLLPLSIVAGGTSSIATITYYLYNINPAIMMFIISSICSILGFMYLGAERTTGTIIASLSYPLVVEITAKIVENVYIDTSDTLLIVLFAGVLAGVANGLMYKSGYSSGGLPTISQILYEKFKISVAKTSFVMNFIIIIIGAIFFGFTNALYAVIFLYIYSIITDKVLLGISKNKAFYIITEKEQEVKEYIIENLRHTVTTFDVKGGYLQDKKRVMLTVIPTREYYRVTEGIKSIDKDVFFVVTDSYQVKGAK
ncbi:MAG: YitT family protein [Bacilli bacterium]|nr:YitT family protein [Bacilli bacterium]